VARRSSSFILLLYFRFVPRPLTVPSLAPFQQRISGPRAALAWLAALLLIAATGCSEPPQKEIDQAQAAVEAARAAGAPRFATDEYNGAAAALERARAAVDQRDYRQGLSYAIDARQRAQAAGRQAAEGKQRAQKAVEALYGEAASRATRLQTLIRDAEAARIKAKDLRASKATLAAARTTLQEASTAITLGNYDEGSKSLTEVRGKLDTAITEVENISQRQPAKTARPVRR
jgi:hypothetical protein